jgi:serine/threonine-protein kinase
MSGTITRVNAALEGRYRIEPELGEGGIATVSLADDLRHERKVALKVLKPEPGFTIDLHGGNSRC